MTLLNLSDRNLTRLEIKGSALIAYTGDTEPETFSLIGVTSLDCSRNWLTSLPLLPEGVKKLNCSNNQLTSLPLLPGKLKELHCWNNRLTRLPPLPEKLELLGCFNNQITSLPLLPRELKELYCSYNCLTSLPPLPERLKRINCFGNSLKYVPFLRKRPEQHFVPASLIEKYSIGNYQEGYRLQEINRYVFLTLFTELGLQLEFLVW